MKYLKFLFLIVFIIMLSSTAAALNLEVDNDLNNFAKENLLNENIQNLKNPFFIKKETVETPETNLKMEEQVEAQTLVNSDRNLTEERKDNSESKEVESEIIINGVISASNSRLALLVSYQQEKHLLKIGDSLEDYRLTDYKNGEATFIKNGKEYEITY